MISASSTFRCAPLSILFGLLTLALVQAPQPASASETAVGACCFADGSCTILTQTDCEAQGGLWQGAGTNCNPNPCPPCLLRCSGACCFPDGHCEFVWQGQCQAEQGDWQGGFTLCEPNPCGTASVPEEPVTETHTWGWIKSTYR